MAVDWVDVAATAGWIAGGLAVTERLYGWRKASAARSHTAGQDPLAHIRESMDARSKRLNGLGQE